MTSKAEHSSKIPLSQIKIISRSFKSIRNEAGMMEEFFKEEIVTYRVPTVSSVIRFAYSRIDILLIVFSAFSFSIFFQLKQPLLLVITYAVMNILYYSILEGLLSATLGKLFFDVIVIDEFAQEINFKKSIPRAFFRMIPFIELSCLSKSDRGWHDKYTDTYVINKKDLKHIRDKVDNAIEGVYTYNEF